MVGRTEDDVNHRVARLISPHIAQSGIRMIRPSSFRWGVLPGLLAATALTLVLAPPVHAAAPGSCDGQVPEQPFIPWADPSSYVLVPNGTVEQGARWNLKGGATRVSGNESHYVHDLADASSLSLPPGSSATTALMCVDVEHPTLRLVARNSGLALSSLLVEVIFEDATGHKRAAPIGTYVGTSSWQPTAPLAVVANLFTLLPGTHDDVAFRFTPKDGGNWSIDDVYVDPFRHG